MKLTRRMMLHGAIAVVAQRMLSGCEAQEAVTTRKSVVRLEDFGGRAIEGFDNVAAFRRAFAEAAKRGSDIRLGPGTYDVSSKSLLAGALRRPSNVALIGAGRSATTLRVTGESIINQLFDASGSSDVLTSGLRLVGNRIKDEAAPYAGGLMIATLAADASNGMTDLRFDQCDIEDFASAAWFNVQNLSDRFSIDRVTSTGCNWFSAPGTTPQSGAITVPGHFIYVLGGAGAVRSINIDDGEMHARHVKGGVALIGNVTDATIAIDQLVEPGLALYKLGQPDGPGAYGIMLYQKPSGAPRRVTVRVRSLIDARSVGIYCAGGRDVTIDIATASGQRDIRDQTLPKGILVILAGRNVRARIGAVVDSNRVMMLSLDGGQDLGEQAGNVGFDIQLDDVRSRPGARDITIDAGVTSWTGGVVVRGSRSGPAAVGVDLRASTTAGLQDIDLSGLRNVGAGVPIVLPAQRRGKSRRLSLPVN